MVKVADSRILAYGISPLKNSSLFCPFIQEQLKIEKNQVRIMKSSNNNIDVLVF